MKGRDLFDRITINPEVMVGKPTIRGMRITVEQILQALAGGPQQKIFLRTTRNLRRKILELPFFTHQNLSAKKGFLL